MLLSALIPVEMMIVMWMIKRQNCSPTAHHCYRRTWSFCSIFTIIFLSVLIDLVNTAWLGFKIYLFQSGKKCSYCHSAIFFHYVLKLSALNMSLTGA